MGGEGKAETQPGAPYRPRIRCRATREAFASHRRILCIGLGRHHSLAHQASARLNRLAAKVPPYLSPTDQRGAEALAGCRISRPFAAERSVMKCLKPPLEQNNDLGPDAARARNRRSGSAARCAG